jgi:hypothetical protein
VQVGVAALEAKGVGCPWILGNRRDDLAPLGNARSACGWHASTFGNAARQRCSAAFAIISIGAWNHAPVT